jgi:iron complex transport system substrate-binding protein
MNRVHWWNGLGLIAALGVAWWAVAGIQYAAPVANHALPAQEIPVETVLLADGRTAVRDVRGALIPLFPYRRIASLSIQSDAILCEVCEPERVVSACHWSVGPWTHRLGALPRLKALENLEAVIALHPDLVLISTFGGELDRVQRLREAGLTVCDLGPQGGVMTLAANARLLGTLLGCPDRAERFVRNFTARLARVAGDVPAARRRTAIYVQCIGDSLFGGTRGTSYHDVLTAAGLIDAAAERYSGWPQYGVEQLITLDPERLVTLRGSAERLRRLPGVMAMRAMRDPAGIIELDDALLQCPGPVMLDAAEALHALAYGNAP